jgi:hypothetical protein
MGIVVVAAACTSSPAAETSTTAGQTPLTTLAADDTTTTSQPTTTTEASRELTPPRYRIVERIEGESEGDTVVVLLDPTSYDSLTDIDLFDIIAEVVELFPPISVIHVVDDPSAANVVANPDASNAEIQAIQEYYLARLDNGLKITYLGPFAASGTAVLGS